MGQQLKDRQSIRSRLQTSNTGLILMLVISLLVLVMAGVFLFSLNRLGSDDVSLADETRATVERLSNYPQDYKAANLPQYPGGEVTFLGAETESNQPVVIYVNTTDKIDKVATYYQMQLQQLNWQENTGRSADTAGVITKVFIRDQQEYRLTITRDDDSAMTNVIISWTK